jgi:hypothetical protein
VHPAFSSNRSAAAMAGGIVLLLVLPVVIKALGLPPREDVWKSVPAGYGPIGRMIWTIYDDRTNPDVLFVGTSRTLEAVDEPKLESLLSNRLDRPVQVRTLALFHDGLDMNYVMLRDYLELHHPKIVMLEVPALNSSGAPHLFLSRWLRFGEDADAFEGLPIKNRVQIYGEMVLGSPRHLVDLVRPNEISKDEETTAAEDAEIDRIGRRGYAGRKFVPDQLPINDSACSIRTLTPSELDSTKEVPGKYAVHFLREIRDLVKSKDAQLILYRSPGEEEYGHTGVSLIAPWAKCLGDGTEVLWAPSKNLFGDISRDRMDDFYADTIHFNMNGRALFTQAIVPSLGSALKTNNSSGGQSGN